MTRLLWRLPVGFHTWLAKMSGGWRIVALLKAGRVVEMRWERWN